MILLDTSVLVALCDRSDHLADRAMHQLRSLKERNLRVTLPVLTEAWHLLEQPWLRKILIEWLRGRAVQIASAMEERQVIAEVWQWLEQYQEHDPDFADAHLVICAADKRSSIWTYDSEFAHLWRHLDGTRIRLTFPIRS
ncbi:MAG TPA: PIN domain-containing protein [Phycisphaerae bacterium]|nr:PIN domain-containing protein [Phycisphaerae bacterium]